MSIEAWLAFSALWFLLPTALAIVFVIYGGHAVIGNGIGRRLLAETHRRWFERAAGGMFVGCAGLLAASALHR